MSDITRSVRDRALLDLVLRIGVVVVAEFTAALQAPSWVTAPLTLLAAAVVVEALARTRGLGWADVMLVGSAGLIVVLIMLGLVLNLLPTGLTTGRWAIGAGLVAIATLLWSRRLALRGSEADREGAVSVLPRPARAQVLRTAPWLVLAGGLVVVALAISTHATDVANRPPLALSVLDRTQAAVSVQVTGGTAAGRYELALVSDGTTRPLTSFDLAAGQARAYRFAVPAQGPTTIELRRRGADRVLRSLIVRSVAR